ITIWIACHLIYPLWFPLNGSRNLAICLILLLLVIGIGLSQYKIQSDYQFYDIFKIPHDKLLWALIALAVVIRAYPLTLPMHLWQAGDEAVHMGFPALPFK